MSVQVRNHNTGETFNIWDIVDIHYDIKGRTLRLLDCFENETILDLKIYDVNMLVK